MRYRRGAGGRSRFAGSFVIEAVISVVILATATYGLVQLARYSADLTRHADGQLAATLIAQNTLARLERLEAEQLESGAVGIERAMAAESGYEVAIMLSPFDLPGRSGFHLQVEVTVEPHVAVTMHDWRIDAAVAPSGESAANRDQGESDEADE